MIIERKTGLNIDQIMTDTKIIVPANFTSQAMALLLKDFIAMQQLYNAAIREISTKFEIFDEEFQVFHSHNPIHHMESRLKSPRSIVNKLRRKGCPFTIEAVKESITDIAGIRVICNYIEDVYAMSRLLLSLDEIVMVKKRDYIKEPKANGYRSLHIVVTLPVHLSTQIERVPVEVQIRTIAMDFWASLEHNLYYKKGPSEMKEDLQIQLRECADEIFDVDIRMQKIHDKLHSDENGRQLTNEKGMDFGGQGGRHSDKNTHLTN